MSPDSPPFEIAGNLDRFFLDCVVIGAAVMSTIQIVRRLFPIRGEFQRTRLERWLNSSVMRLDAKFGTPSTYDLPAEMLTAQLSAVAEEILDQSSSPPVPPGGSHLYDEWLRDRQKDYELLQKMSGAELGGQRERWSDDPQIRARIAYSIQRNLDKFQIETSARWRRSLLAASLILSAAFFSLGSFLLNITSFLAGTHWLAKPLGVLAGALFAGYIATVMRDLVAIVERLRR